MADEHPILRSLLDSLTTINQRLNLIENALSIPPALPTTAQKDGGHAHGPQHHHRSGVAAVASRSRRPLPSAAPSQAAQPAPHYTAATAASIASLPSPPPYHGPAGLTIAPYPPPFSLTPQPSPSAAATPTSTATAAQPSAKRASHQQLVRLQQNNARIKFEEYDNSGDEEEGEEGDDDRAEDQQQGGEGEDEDEEDEEDDDDDDDDDHQAGGDGHGHDGGSLPKALQPTGVGQSRLEALPEGFVVTARATLQEELDGWTIPRGYSMRINGTRSHGRRQKIRMVCFRGGRSRLRPKEEEAKRERERERARRLGGAAGGGGGLFSPTDLPLPPGPHSRRRRKPTTDRISKKCECPFRFELVEVYPGADRYAVHYTNDDHTQHNHAAADLMLDPRARKLPRALKAEVDQWLRGGLPAAAAGGSSNTNNNGGGWTIAKIQAELQRRGYGHVLDFDLRNRKRALLHKERLAQLKKEGGGGAKEGAGGGESSAGGDTPTAMGG